MKQINVILIAMYLCAGLHQVRAESYYIRLTSVFCNENFGDKNIDALKTRIQNQIGSGAMINQFRQVAPTIDVEGLNRVFFLETSDNSFQKIQRMSFVEFIEVVPIYKLDVMPNDPQVSTQWHLSTINAFNAWNVSTGSNTVKVAIVDNAVMTNHQDLSANIYTNTGEIPNNGIDDDGNGYIDDVNGYDVADNDNNANPPNPTFNHGTHCAGIACATSNNNVGIASIGYSCKIIPVKATASASSPGFITDPASGVAYAIAARANVVSMSYGGTGYSSVLQQLYNAGAQQGVVFVAAAGNSNSSQMQYPAAYNSVISVAATNPSDQKASFSNYGTWVDIAAPGTNIFSTLPNTTTGTYGAMSGTSMACPLVAGLCALMKANTPSLTPAQLETCLKQSADNINSANPSYSNLLGAGRINALAALNCQSCNAVAQFTSSNSLISYPKNSSVCFTATGTGTSYNWSIDGTNLSGMNPCYSFANAGYYNVCHFTGGSFAGCADTVCKSFTIYDTTNINICSPRYGNKWIFGAGAMLDFSADPPISSGPVSGFNSNEASSSISDKCGNLLFYSNAATIFDASRIAMPNGTGLNGVGTTTNGVRILPVPGSQNRYYVFTLTEVLQTGLNDGCYYHVVDMTLRGNGTALQPKGDVLIKNQPLQRTSDFNVTLSEKTTVIRHANGLDYWFILHNNYSTTYPGPFNKFFVYRISATGITGPTVYSVGTSFLTSTNGIGEMEANNAGTKIALCATQQYTSANGFIQLFDFDKSTGAITNPVSVSSTLFNNYAVAFSPDDQNLFYQVSNLSLNIGEIKMYRIPTATTSSVASNIAHIPMGMQLGPDGKIYINNIVTTSVGSWPSANALSTINNPNASTAAGVNYLYENVALTAECRVNISVFSGSDMRSIPPQVTYNDTICVSDTSRFDLDVNICSGLDGQLTYLWNFGDPTSGSNNTSTVMNASHRFSSPGLYNVKVRASALCYNDSITIPVLVQDCKTTTVPVTFRPLTDTLSCPTPDSIQVEVGGSNYYKVLINGVSQGYKYLGQTSGTSTTRRLSISGYATPLNICTVFYDDTLQAGIDTICRTVYGGTFAITRVLRDTALCSAGGVLLNAGNQGNSYLWSTGATTQSITVTSSGNYVVTISNSQGCTAKDSARVSLSNLLLNINSSNTTCGLQNGAVYVNALNGISPYFFQWNTGSTSNSILNVPSGNYTVTATDGNGCTATASSVVNPSGASTIEISGSKSTICSYDSASLCAPAGYQTYTWNTGDTSRCIVTRIAGNYVVSVTDVGNCTITSNTFTLNVLSSPFASITANGDTLTASSGVAYQWYFNGIAIVGANSQSYIATFQGNYSVMVTGNSGCYAMSGYFNYTTGIDEITDGVTILLYPNPSYSGGVTLEISPQLLGNVFSVYDDAGKLVYSDSIKELVTTFDLNVSRGVYICRIVSNQRTITKKLIKL